MARAAVLGGRPALPLEAFDIFLYPLGRREALLDVVLIIGLALSFEIVAGIVVGAYLALVLDFPITEAGGLSPETQRQILFPMIALRAVITVGLVAAFVRYRKQSASAVGLRRGGLAMDGFLGVALTFVVYGVIALALLLLMLVWPQIPKQMEENAWILFDLIPAGAGPPALLGMAVAIGVYEELLFRGFLMPRLRRATGSWWPAVVVSSGAFTALHALEQTPAALVIVFILSVSFSLVTIWRRSIVPAIVAHALFDFSQFVLLTVQREAMGG